MLDLFEDRVFFNFFFLLVGIDIFGLWLVVICKMRGG